MSKTELVKLHAPALPDAFFTLFNDTCIHFSHAGNIPWSHPKSVLLNHSCTLESPGNKAERHCPRSAMLKLRNANNSLAKTGLIQWVWSTARHSAAVTLSLSGVMITSFALTFYT